MIQTAPASYVALVATNHLFTVLDEWSLQGNEIHIKTRPFDFKVFSEDVLREKR